MLEIFYNEIIKEASRGKVECIQFYHILFNTKIPEIAIDLKYNDNDEMFVPTLFINNKKEFDELLLEYTNLAFKYYELENKYTSMDAKTRIHYLNKTLMAFLWANATIEDFNDPNSYIKNRIEFIKNEMFPCYEKRDLGYSEILKSNIFVENRKATFFAEAPYSLKITLTDNENEYKLPLIYYGIVDDTIYIYAIQNEKDVNKEDNAYQKYIKRALYKVNVGFDSKNDNFKTFDKGNLKDITPSFLLALNIFVGLLENYGIKKIVVPSILIVRWNAKELVLQRKKMLRLYEVENDEAKKKEINEYFDELSQIHNDIQSNMTEKLIRTFLRLAHHNNGLGILNIPSELNSSLIIELDKILSINNPLLNETYNLTQIKHNKSK